MQRNSSLVPTRGVTCRRATSAEDLAAAAELTSEVYRTRLSLSEGACARAGFERQQYVLLVWDADRPVSTMTLQSPAFDTEDAPAVPFELEAAYKLETLQIPRRTVAEVRRFATRPGNPQAFRCLLNRAAEVSSAHGVINWLGLVEAEATLPSDAPFIHAAVRAQGLAMQPLPMRPRNRSELYEDELLDGERMYCPEIMRSLPVPTTVRRFGRVLGAKAVSVPTMHPCYRKLVLPMLARVPQTPSHRVSITHGYRPMDLVDEGASDVAI